MREELAGSSYTVRELAELSGCTVRALRHYDELGLVSPRRAANNYRLYGPAEVERLQQVLLYRACGMALADIGRVLDDPSFDARTALEGHARELRARRARLDDLLASVERTLAHMDGTEGEPMHDEDRFAAFKRRMVDENERTHGAEARGAWGDAAVDGGNEKVLRMSEEEWRQTQDLESRLAEALRVGVAAREAGDEELASRCSREAFELHRQWLRRFWADGAYTPAAHRGLAALYLADDRFASHYEAMAPGGTGFLCQAIEACCA